MDTEDARRMLQSPDPKQRKEALGHLYSALPKELVPVLFDLLKQQAPGTVGTAMAVLDEYGLDEELASPEFFELVRSPDCEVRSAAFSVIKKVTLKGCSVLQEVIRSVSDRDAYIRFLCMDILKSVDHVVLDSYLHVALTPVPFWKNEIQSQIPGNRNRAILALGAYGAVAVPILRSELRAPDPETRQLALMSLARIGVPALEAIGAGLRDADPDVRKEAARALAAAGAGAVEYLVPAFGDEEPEVRATALQSVAALDKLAAWAIPSLLPLLVDSVDRVRDIALATLEGLSPYAGPYAEAIVGTLGTISARLQSSPVAAVAHFGKAKPEDLAVLLGALKEERDRIVAMAAAVLLWSAYPIGFETTPVLKALEALAQHPPQSSYLLESILSWLPQSGPQVARFLRFVIEYCLRSGYTEVRNRAESWLQSLEVPESTVVPALVELLGDPYDELQIGAAQALFELGAKGAAAAEALTRCLNNDSEDLRFMAALALSRVDPTSKAPIPILMDALRYTGFEIQVSAEEALRRLKAGTCEN